MNGIAYYRIKHSLSQRQLAEQANIHYQTIKTYENPDSSSRGNGLTYLRISDVLGVPIDELIREDYPDINDPTFSRKLCKSRTSNPYNPISRYREMHSLTFKKLALRLGRTSRECARQACESEVPLEAHVEALAVYEGISVGEFNRKYESKRKKN